ncbi:MAG: SusD/RagB family nutrient-binding outer membrane lipoprotein [Bacteroidota bacterium]
MKKISIQRLAVLALALSLFFTSCKRYSSDFGDTNVNPGVTGSPLFNALMTNVQAGIAGYASQTRGGLYCQYFSETQYTDVSLYSLPQINFEGNYSGALNDLQNIINNGPNDNMKAVARILKSYIFSTITDSWGDVPYAQSLQGNGTPVFDRQSDIYTGMISELAAAVNQLGGSAAVSGDIIYGGNIMKWKKLANSLRMRLALQLSKKYPNSGQYSAVQFSAALNHPDGYIIDNADNFKVTFPGGNFKSPWYNLYDGRIDFGESETMTALMSSLGDGRQAAYGSSSLGVPYGRLRSFIDPWTSSNPTWARILNPSFRPENGTVMLLTAAEVFLARAEAADRGWTSENMNSVYQQGINASFAQWGLAAPAAAYFTQASVAIPNLAGTAANIRNIAIQEYVAGYPDGLRGWCIWRRTGWPVLTPAPDATNTSRQIPQRYTYGQQSYGSNAANTNAAATAIGGDNQDTKVWWAQ